MCRRMENSTSTFPAEVEQGNALPSCYSSYMVNKGPFRGLFNATFFAFLCVLFGDFAV